MGRERLFVWIVLGLLALSTANLGGWFRGVVFEWLPLGLVLAAYDLLRGHADGLLFSTWYRPQLEADSFLFGGTVPTVWLQDRLWHGSANLRWYDYATWAVYMSYFAATYLPAGLLWSSLRARFRRDVGSVALLAGMAFATFALFPAAPPAAGEPGRRVHPTTRLIGPVTSHIPFLSFCSRVYERAPSIESRGCGAVVACGLHLFDHAVSSARGDGRTVSRRRTRSQWRSRSSTQPSTTRRHPPRPVYMVAAVWIVSRVANRVSGARRPAADPSSSRS